MGRCKTCAILRNEAYFLYAAMRNDTHNAASRLFKQPVTTVCAASSHMAQDAYPYQPGGPHESPRQTPRLRHASEFPGAGPCRTHQGTPLRPAWPDCSDNRPNRLLFTNLNDVSGNNPIHNSTSGRSLLDEGKHHIRHSSRQKRCVSKYSMECLDCQDASRTD